MYSMIRTGVDLEDLNEYLRVFVIQRGGSMNDYRGEIDIGVEYNTNDDIRDALVLLNEAPHVWARFSTREVDQYTELGVDGCESELEPVLLSSALEYPKFWDFLLTKTSPVMLGTNGILFSDHDGMPLRSSYVSVMEIWVKAEFAEDWMHLGFDREADKWQSELDLPERAFIRLHVENKE